MVTQGPKIRLGQIGKAIHRADGTIVDNGDVIEGIVLLRKGRRRQDPTLDAIHDKVKELNEQHSAAWREGCSFSGPQRPASFYDRTRCCTT